MTEPLLNLMRREAERAMSQRAVTLMGVVSGYDPDHYAAKVKLQPDGQETGFLPVASPWVGAGWGFYAPPSVGDVVDVHFQEGGKGAPYVSLRFYGNAAPPLSVPPGEAWLVHRSGSLLKFRNDGTIEISAAAAIRSSAPAWSHTGDVTVDGTIRATGDIIDRHTSGGYTMASFRATYNGHTHGGITGGSGHTEAPDQEL